jgi:hypothetical protein
MVGMGKELIVGVGKKISQKTCEDVKKEVR